MELCQTVLALTEPLQHTHSANLFPDGWSIPVKSGVENSMCSRYWNLSAPTPCARCGTLFANDLQTHFMGDDGSCVNYYQLHDTVAELQRVSVVLDGTNDDFIGEKYCPACRAEINDPKHEFQDFGAEIRDGAVVRVWPIVRPLVHTIR